MGETMYGCGVVMAKRYAQTPRLTPGPVLRLCVYSSTAVSRRVLVQGWNSSLNSVILRGKTSGEVPVGTSPR
jgi:hypothetical protein